MKYRNVFFLNNETQKLEYKKKISFSYKAKLENWGTKTFFLRIKLENRYNDIIIWLDHPIQYITSIKQFYIIMNSFQLIIPPLLVLRLIFKLKSIFSIMHYQLVSTTNLYQKTWKSEDLCKRFNLSANQHLNMMIRRHLALSWKVSFILSSKASSYTILKDITLVLLA